MREQTIKQATKSLLGYVTCVQGIIESGHVQNYRQHRGANTPTTGCLTHKVFRTPHDQTPQEVVSKHLHPLDLGIIVACKCNHACYRQSKST